MLRSPYALLLGMLIAMGMVCPAGALANDTVTPVGDLGPFDEVKRVEGEDEEVDAGDEDPRDWVDPFADRELLQGIALPWAAGACVSFAGVIVPAGCGGVGLTILVNPTLAPCGLLFGVAGAAGVCAAPLAEGWLLSSVGNRNPRWPNVDSFDGYVIAAAYASYFLAFAGYVASSFIFITIMGFGTQAGLFPFLNNGDSQFAFVIGLAMAAAGGLTLLALQPLAPLMAYLFSASERMTPREDRLPAPPSEAPPPPSAREGMLEPRGDARGPASLGAGLASRPAAFAF